MINSGQNPGDVWDRAFVNDKAIVSSSRSRQGGRGVRANTTVVADPEVENIFEPYGD
jgi:hypothetical protein